MRSSKICWTAYIIHIMYLFVFYCTFLLLLFLIPSVITFKRTGINPLRFGKGNSAIDYVGRIYRLISLFAFVTVVLNAFFTEFLEYLEPLEFFQTQVFSWIGYGLIHFAFLWIFIAQRNLADEWRIGIDNENKVNLVTRGLFGISRNPIFLGVILLFIGLFFLLPNVLTAIILVSGYIVIQIQVRLEEQFLSEKLGPEYQRYKEKVRRWLI